MSKRFLQRKQRKLEHLELAKNLPDGPLATGFEDIRLVHQAAASQNLAEIDLTTDFFGKSLSAPILINAITGGTRLSKRINSSLAKVAKELGIGFAVGSQMIALDNADTIETFKVARKKNPNGLLLANLSATASPEKALIAVEMLQADGLQLHLNLAQELSMPEGDRDFKNILDNISEIVQKSPVPIIVKEVGFGISAETAKQLFQCQVKYLDVGGQGGTNFATIERLRQGLQERSVFEYWGIPTAISLAEVRSLGLPVTVIASGGIRSALDMIKAFAIGSQMIGIAGPFLKTLLNHSELQLSAELSRVINEFKCLVLLTGARSLKDLEEIPLIISGKTKDWLEQRGILNKLLQAKN